MAPKFALFTKGSKLLLKKGFKNMFELLQSCAQALNYVLEHRFLLGMVHIIKLTHCILNRLSHTIYWKSPIPILGTYSYEIYIFLEKNG